MCLYGIIYALHIYSIYHIIIIRFIKSFIDAR